jgi:hypothetical protein
MTKKQRKAIGRKTLQKQTIKEQQRGKIYRKHT